MTRRLIFTLALSLGAGACVSKPVDPMQPIRESLDRIENDAAIADVSDNPLIALDLRYASTNNFMKKDMYGPLQRCYLHRDAAEKLKRAIAILKAEHPGYKLKVFDCLRPRSVQRVLWSGVVGTPQEKYVADPDKSSIHNYGFAIDLSLENAEGKELDMGTPFDDFTPLAEPQLEAKFLKEKQLTQSQVFNRKILRKVMTRAGFEQLPHEWWHYNALPLEQLKSHYRIVE